MVYFRRRFIGKTIFEGAPTTTATIQGGFLLSMYNPLSQVLHAFRQEKYYFDKPADFHIFLIVY